MRIYTSYFANVRHLPEDMYALPIVRYAPKTWQGDNYSRLAPPYKVFRLESETEFTLQYNNYLASLNRKIILSEIERLAGGVDVALLCYERPGQFCHRHLAAKWLSAWLPYQIEEWSYKEPEPKPIPQKPQLHLF